MVEKPSRIFVNTRRLESMEKERLKNMYKEVKVTEKKFKREPGEHSWPIGLGREQWRGEIAIHRHFREEAWKSF